MGDRAGAPCTSGTEVIRCALWRRPSDATTIHAFTVTDSLVEYQQIVARLDPTLKTTRIDADYLRSIEINTRA